VGLLDSIERERALRLEKAAAGPLVEKQGGIWGGEFYSFHGIDQSSGGVSEVQDNKADYSRARTAESYVFTCEQVRGKAISQVPLKC